MCNIMVIGYANTEALTAHAMKMILNQKAEKDSKYHMANSLI